MTLTSEGIATLIYSLVWLLAGVGVFMVGMSFMSDALESSAGGGMKKLLGKISNNRILGVGIGAGVTAIVQSSSATSVMVIGLVNAGAVSLVQATPIIMGANIGTTVTGVLVALKNDYFNTAMYLLLFVGVLMSFSRKEKIKLLGSLFCGLGLIFVGLNIMSSDQAFGNPLVEELFVRIFGAVRSPLILIFIGATFTALIQSSSAATGVVITMVGTGVLSLESALFIVLGANIGTCVTALLASIGANSNSKRIAFIHFAFNATGAAAFAALIWTFSDIVIGALVSAFPGEDAMALQMRVSLFHVIFNVSTTLLLLPFVKQLVKISCHIIKEKTSGEQGISLRYVDDRLLHTPPIALMQVKKEINYMMSLVEENTALSFVALEMGSLEYSERISRNEEIVDFTNVALTRFLIELSANVEPSDERVIGAYFHVLNDLERIGDHAENFHGIGVQIKQRKLTLSDSALSELLGMRDRVMEMFSVAQSAFRTCDSTALPRIDQLEEQVDTAKRTLTAKHFARLTDGSCDISLSPYYSSVVAGLERVADHLVNVGYSIVDPTGSQRRLQ